MSLPTPVLPAEPTLFPLTDLAITRLTGNDRVKYLQGQVTCDVNTLQPGQSTPSIPIPRKYSMVLLR